MVFARDGAERLFGLDRLASVFGASDALVLSDVPPSAAAEVESTRAELHRGPKE
jgi:hypothetical protein